MSSEGNHRTQHQDGGHHDHDHHGEPARLGSPSHMSTLHGGLSPEDIQELLGDVWVDPHHPHHHSDQGQQDSDQGEQHPESSNEQDNPCGSINGIHNDVKAAARSERKRSREKQRRSDVNKQFATLTDLLRDIESSHTDLFASPVWTEASFSPTNRVELMARTIHVLTTMENSHKRQKTRIQELEVQLEEAKKAGEEAAAKAKEKMMSPMQAGQNQVVMMVPMLFGGGQATAGGAPGPAPSAAQHPMTFMPMPTGASPGDATTQGGGMAMPGGMPWMMPHPMSQWGMPMMTSTAGGIPTMQASTNTGGSSAEETKQAASSSDNTATSNLAHCA